MGVRILEDRKSGEAVFYCSTTDWAFGPVMKDGETAEAFFKWLNTDPRLMTDSQLEGRWVEFNQQNSETKHDECG